MFLGGLDELSPEQLGTMTEVEQSAWAERIAAAQAAAEIADMAAQCARDSADHKADDNILKLKLERMRAQRPRSLRGRSMDFMEADDSFQVGKQPTLKQAVVKDALDNFEAKVGKLKSKVQQVGNKANKSVKSVGN